MKPGALDETLPRVLPMVDTQLFGMVAEEKEAGAFAGTREAKKLRAYDTYLLLAQGITFKANLATLLSLVRHPVPLCGLYNAFFLQGSAFEIAQSFRIRSIALELVTI